MIYHEEPHKDAANAVKGITGAATPQGTTKKDQNR